MSNSRRGALFAALVLVSLAGCALALAMGWLSPRTLVEAAREAGWRGAAIFVGLVVLMELLWLPRMWALVSAAVLFGPVRGVLISLVADSLSAVLCYLVGRSVGRGWVEGLVATRPRARRALDLLVTRRGWAAVAVLRVVPVAHYTLVSYLAGLAGIGPRPFLAGNTLGLLPGAVLYAAVGASALRPTSPAFLLSMGILVIALVATGLLGRRLLR